MPKTNKRNTTKSSSSPKRNSKVNETQTSYIKILISLEQVIFNLTNENIELSIRRTMELFNSKYPYSFNSVICTLIYYAFSSQKCEINTYLKYLEMLQAEEEMNKEYPKVIKIFTNFISEIVSKEKYYIIERMIELKLIDVNILKNINSNYFMHRKTKTENNVLDNQNKSRRNRKRIEPIEKPLVENYEELSNNDFELHEKYIKEGHNPNEIAKIIRNDEIEKLKEISSQTNFDFNQTIEPSLYERCSFINKENVTLIDYAAFFGSIKCFKYLLMNSANVKNIGKYAVAGGNEEIIHLCEQNHSSFEGAYEAAIMFHRNDIFKYLYENKTEDIDNLKELGEKCVSYFNYEIFTYLEKEGMKINENIIKEAAKIGNIFLVKYFLKNNQLLGNILVFASFSGNIELVTYILKQKEIDINAKDIYLF